MVAEAFKEGKLSEAQAKQIASAADRCPEMARELVEVAGFSSFGQLKKQCDQVRSGSDSAEDELTRHERIRKSRFCKTWVDSDGAGHLEAKMTVDALAVVKTALGVFEKEIFGAARADGLRETHQAYLADALVAMARAAVTGSSSSEDDLKALLRVRIDGDALLRGHAIVGETCEIPGLGSVPVAHARRLIGDALLELVITRGVDVTTVVSDSRYVRKALRIALEERDPTCVVPGCDMSDPLDRDHWRVDFGKDGPTCIDNLARLCRYHHHQKTHRGWVLDGGPGQWRFYKPDATGGADDTPGTDCESESDVPDTAAARQAKRRATPANDPPEQQPLL